MSAGEPAIRFSGVVLDCPDPSALADFYRELLGMTVVKKDHDWVTLRGPGDTVVLSFQRAPEFRPPVWPSRPDEQQMMVHLDLDVVDLEKSVRKAVGLGARVADVHPVAHVKVLFDPSGHPFCLSAQHSPLVQGR